MHPVQRRGLLGSQDAPQLETHLTHLPLGANTYPKLHWLHAVALQFKHPVGQDVFASTQDVILSMNPILHAVQTIGDEHVVQLRGQATQLPEDKTLSVGQEVHVLILEESQL